MEKSLYGKPEKVLSGAQFRMAVELERCPDDQE